MEQIFCQTKTGFMDFLRGLFKGAEYVELAYMTGILPIKKYGEHSALNIFDEYSMADPKSLGGILWIYKRGSSRAVPALWYRLYRNEGMVRWILCG